MLIIARGLLKSCGIKSKLQAEALERLSDLIAVPARKAMQQRQTFKASASQWQRDLLIEFDVLAEAEKAARQADPRVVAFRKHLAAGDRVLGSGLAA